MELSELFQEVVTRITRQVPKESFAADILDRKGIFTLVNNMRILQKEELLKHCREPYQWSKELRPGDVIGFEVRVTPDNNEFEVTWFLDYFKKILFFFYCK